ncbi:MAG TPA: three-Cys-motif partner protein TcmP [Rhizomicrobium sp.]|nr:three-Cys-motif partner protein TcmP [Rhizomicrobium sp.]
MPKSHYGWEVGGVLPDIGSHSLAKHRIIRKYVERYIEILTAISWQEQLNITFVDGYAGGGRYAFGAATVPGSPLILLEAVAQAEAQLDASRAKGFRINAEFIFIDSDPKHVEFLREEILKSPYASNLDSTIRIWCGDFNERVQDAIAVAKARSRKGRSIFLLDQYGWSQVAFRSVREILASLEKAEVFLTFSVDSLISYLSENSHNLRAFGEIDMDPAMVKEIVAVKESEQIGYRALIQNTLYDHVQRATNAPFYSPFFIKSPEASRSYWFIHLSKHREARNEIGMIHWAENNTTVHHGRAGFHALGFTPGGVSPEQIEMTYFFDGHAKEMSRKALLEELPRAIYDAANSDVAPTLEEVFGQRCNDTPVVREQLESVLVELRDAKELTIVGDNGKVRPRTSTVDWTDRIVLPRQLSFLGPFSKLK